MNRRFKKIVVFIPLIVAIIMNSSFFAQAQEETTTIKVGYTLNNGTVKSPVVIGEEGYGYEYLNKIFQYIEEDYKLEYVYCETSELYDMLDRGEIDIAGPVTYTEDLNDSYIFTEMSFGDNFVFLSTMSDEIANHNSYADIDGSKIGIQEGNTNEGLLIEFLEENNLEAEIVYFTECDLEVAMEEYDCDFCLCTSLNSFTNLTPVFNLGCVEAYYITSEENADLMSEINAAMEEVHDLEYMYQEKLYLEYYDYSILSDSYITDEEYALLQEQGVYYIGIEDIYGPIGYKNDDGEFVGIAVDVMEMIAEIAGIEYEFVEVTEETTQEELEALNFSFLSYDENGRSNTVESEPFCQMTYIMVERPMDEDEEITNVGILTHYGLTESADEGYLFEREVVEYDSLLGLQEAYIAGELDSMVMTASNMNLVRNGFDDSDYVVTTLDISLNMCLIFQDTYPSEQVVIFNKIIEQLDDKAIASLVMFYSTPESSTMTVKDVAREYPYLLPSLAIVAALILISIILVVGHERKKELSRQLNYDKLTGLYSGFRFEEEVDKILVGDMVDQYYIVTIDIDNFKYINDVFGHEIGNEVIKTVARCVRKIAPEAIAVARSSGDIFMVLIKRDLSEERILAFTPEQRDKLFDELIPLIGETYKLSFSIGLYDISDKSLDINFMIDCANIARIEGKSFAYTTINMYNKDMDRKRILSTEMITNMVQGINGHEFVVYYQPKVTLKDKTLVGAEALVRWFRNGTLIPPNDFIPLFEKNGFIERLDLYVLEAVCTFINKYPTAPKISVNLSGVTITKIGIADEIQAMVDNYKVPHEKLEFEVTETAFVDEYERVIHSLEQLRTCGFSISMDDFGVGTSSLSRLKSMPIDILKIDREFIWDSIGNEKGIVILKNIIDMANGLKLETVAEGVENETHEALLLQLGCEIGQGYHYSPPLLETKFLGWFQH